jgi:hypothetical protein
MNASQSTHKKQDEVAVDWLDQHLLEVFDLAYWDTLSQHMKAAISSNLTQP